MGKDVEAKRGIIEALSRNVGLSNIGSLFLGFAVAILLRSSGALESAGTAYVLAVAVALLLVVLFTARLQEERWLDRFRRWGVISIGIGGFAFGALLYQYRHWGKWLWTNYRRINEPEELILEGLFLLGVMLGFFVIRNWAKEEKDFINSLAAVLGGAVIATALGPLTEKIEPFRSFAYYFLGFAISGTVNLFIFSRLVAGYSNTGAIIYRSFIELLYGSDKAKTIDGYFLKNYEANADYARKAMHDTLSQYRDVVKAEFTEKMEARRKIRAAKLEVQTAVDAAPDKPTTKPDAEPPEKPKPENPQPPPSVAKPPEQTVSENPLTAQPDKAAKLYYYELLYIEGKRAKGDAKAEDKEKVKVFFREVDEIKEKMFRLGISIRVLDNLQYIVYPGEFKKTFPYFGSVAGLALETGKTIVMDRDRYRKYRTGSYIEGRTPDEIEQPRGLDEIDFLSYIAVPVFEDPVKFGLIHVDTKLFASPYQLKDIAEKVPYAKGESAQNDGNKDKELWDGKTWQMTFSRKELTKLGSNIYEQEDECVDYLKSMGAVIMPILRLYLRSLQGTK